MDVNSNQIRTVGGATHSAIDPDHSPSGDDDPAGNGEQKQSTANDLV
jgi:hypothetical protein